MKTLMRLSLGMVLTASLIGCHTCGQPSCLHQSCLHKSCLHKLFSNNCGCGCQDAQCGGDCGCDGEVACGAQRIRTHRSKGRPSPESGMYGYGNSAVYPGDDWQGMSQPAMGVMPMSGTCGGCGGGAPNMMPSPSGGGCSSCGGGPSVPPQPAAGGCASCAAGAHSMPAAPSSGGGCASCGAGATLEPFYTPMNTNQLPPNPAPPAEGIPGQNNESSPGDKATSQGESIQRINWVPRQF